MIQEIITYLILVATIFVALLKIFRFFTRKPITMCNNCFQTQSDCKVAHLMKRIQVKQYQISLKKL